jgi:Protein of unknown function, DUF481
MSPRVPVGEDFIETETRYGNSSSHSRLHLSLLFAQRKIIKLNPISESFWHRFDGAVNTGLLYSKGNESTQFNLSSQVVYTRERWYSQVDFNSSFASNSGSNVTTRNQADIEGTRLLRWNHWFFAGTSSFLQSSVQQINLQTTLAAGVGRYLKNTNRASISVFGGLGWQNATYGSNIVDQGSQNTAVGLVATQIKAFNSKRQIWMSRPLSYRRSPAPDVSISMRMRSTTSSSATISRGTFRSTEVGILALRQHSRRAITEPVQESVGPLATDNLYLVLVFRETPDDGND